MMTRMVYAAPKSFLGRLPSINIIMTLFPD